MSGLTARDQLFRRVPGPSPWYLADDVVPIEGFSWRKADTDKKESAGKILLQNSSGIVGVFDMYNYVSTLDRSALLVWNQRPMRGQSVNVSPVELFVIELDKLEPLSQPLDAVYAHLNAKRSFFVVGGAPSARMELQTSNVDSFLQADFPDAMRSMGELLILCHSSGVPVTDKSVDLALIVAEPRASVYRLYPQDWFNHADMDFGYQWVTRVVRNPNTGRIEGEGFRIPPFVLDKSMRKLERRADTHS